MDKQVTLSFTADELEALNYALNSAAIHAYDLKFIDFCDELNALWLRIYRVQKSL